MKYWRGYLVALIAAAGIWGLNTFAQTHSVLVDMVYPYTTRILQTYLAQWSADVNFCVWQVLLLMLAAVVLASIVLMIIFKWNPIQWFGWILAGVFLISLLNTGIYGLNEKAGSLAEDIRLEGTEYRYTVSELEAAAAFYRDKANELADQVSRDSEGNLQFPSFAELAEQAGKGFEVLTYEQYYSVFAGSTVPVKELGASDFFTARGITGLTVALTGESAVNPQIPAVSMPFAMCHEMAHRMCIAIDRDADFAAFLACQANPSPEFQYSAYFMAFHHCYEAMKTVDTGTSYAGQTALQNLEAGISAGLWQDLQTYAEFFGEKEALDNEVCDLLVIWHIQKYVLPLYEEEDENPFDPKDENAVDLSGIVHAVTQA